MKRTFAVLLALMTIVPSIVPAAAQQPSPPEDPAPDDPLPEDPAPEDPAPEDPAPEDPTPEDPAPEDPPDEPPQTPSGVDPGNSSNPRATYFEESFENLTGFAQVQLEDDRPDETIWHVEPQGFNGSKAAVLSTSEGLPRGLHQALVSPTVDLTPVPSIVEEPTAASASDAAVDRVNRAGQAAIRSGIAAGAQSEGIDPARTLRQSPVLTTGPLTLPRGPATLTLLHSFNFDDTRNEQGEAVSGFSIEARTPGGEWVPVEASMVARPLHDAGAPGPTRQAQQAGELLPEEVSPCQFERSVQQTLDDFANAFFGGDFNEDPLGTGLAECDQEGLSTDVEADVDQLVLDAGSVTFQVSTSPANNQSGPGGEQGAPVFPNAHIEPLDQRGYTGVSDTDEDGQAEVVGHVFDLSPWAGERVELRMRAGTSAVTEVPGGFWAIDHMEVRAAARSADLRVNLTAPSLDHEAPSDQVFPIRAEVQNVGSTAQEGPFEVNFTVTRDGVTVAQEIVEAPSDQLAFLETTTAQLNFTPLTGAPYQVNAQLVRGHADQDPRNDADADILPVGTDSSALLRILPEASVVDPNTPLSTQVVVESQSNVPLDGNLTLTAFPYDPTTQLPIGEGAVPFSPAEIHLPPIAAKHPQGVEEAVESANFTGTLPKGAYLLVARLGDSTAQTPLGVGTPPPPVLSEDFSSIDAGPASFTFETRSGEWNVEPDSDVMPVPPIVDPGSSDTGSAWVPLSHESTVLRPEGGENVTSGSQDTPQPDTGEGNCLGPFPAAGEVCPPAETDTERIGSPLVIESPQGTQRIHAMATEVPLFNATEAELEFLSSLIPPQDGSGLTEARVYVATDRDVESLVSQVTDPENCPREGPCEVVNERTGLLAVDESADRLVRSVFNLERSVRCAIPEAVGALVESSTNTTDQVPTIRNTEGTIKSVTCPDAAGGAAESGTCTTTGGVTQGAGRVCLADEPAQLSALAPMLSGTLVHRDTTPHTWERHELSLDAWAGQNVTVGFVFLTESQQASERYNLRPYGAVGENSFRGDSTLARFTPALSGSIGYEPPGQPQGAYLTSRVQVVTDDGIKLGPEETQRISNEIVNTAQNQRPGRATQGWSTVGYTHVSGLGDPQTPLRTSAQFLTGTGRPGAQGANPSDGLLLGERQDTQVGVQLYARQLHAEAQGPSGNEPGRLSDPAEDPAVTVVSSPTLDLSGTEDPILRFRQKFDLGTTHGPQGTTKILSRSDVAAALQLPTNVTKDERCDVGDRNDRLSSDPANVTLEGLRCVLEEKRDEVQDFNVQNDVLRPTVAQPRVSAGLYVRARTVTDQGVSETELVEPVDGYRYPIGDSGGFEPTLDYTVKSPDSFPGWTTPTNRDTLGVNGAFQQATYTSTLVPSNVGTPLWAGDSDVDGDGTADWVTSTLDLSEFAGERIELEFVLVARQNQTTSAPNVADQNGHILSKEPWSIDGVEVVGADTKGEVALEEMRWPTSKLPVVTPGEDLPVRVTVTSPTGLDKPIHAKSVVVDAEGCVRGTDTVQARFENQAGRVTPMPADATLDLPEMVIPGENLEDSASPWNVKVGVDAGSEPSVLAPSSIEQQPIVGEVSRFDASDALNVTQGAFLNMTAQDPQCEPSVDIVTVVPTSLRPVVEKDEAADEQLSFQVEIHDDSDSFQDTNRLTGDTRRAFEDGDGKHAPMLLAVSEGAGSDAGGESFLMYANRSAEQRTARVEVPSDRVPVGSPVPVTLDSPMDLDRALLWSVDPSQSRPDPVRLWSGTVEANEDLEIPVTLDEPGPELLVLTGQNEDRSSVIGGTLVVVSDVKSAGDPTLVDNQAELQTIAGRQQDLTVQSVDVTPSSALSTTPRRVDARVQNTGTTTLENVTVAFRVEGDLITEKSRDELKAGEVATFTLPEFTTGSQPSVVLRVEASSDEGLTASSAAPVRSLVKLRTLSPSLTEDSDGWQTSGDAAQFVDPDTGEAPRDTSGSVDLNGARMEGLAGVAVQLDHRLDMEERFDGGQVILSNDTNTTPLTTGPATQEMGPFSPIGGKALTGTRDSSADTVQLNTSNVDMETLVDQTGVDLFGFPLLSEEPEAEPEDMRFADCASRTFTDDQLNLDRDQPYCVHADPAVPTPATAMSRGVFFLQPSEFLSSEDSWTATKGDKRYTVSVREATSFLFLEAGRDLVASAQEEGKLEVRFDEARLIRPMFDITERPLSVQVCARFMHVDEVDENNPEMGYTIETNDPFLNPARRCTGLTHDTVRDQTLEKPWSQSILTIGNIPQAPSHADDRYNLVRLEFSLEQDRTGLRDTTGLMGRGQDTLTNVGLERPTKGWFVGPVTAEAGDTDKTWTPSARDLTSTDPSTGLDPGELENRRSQLESFNLGTRYERTVDQFGVVGFTDLVVTEHDTDSGDVERQVLSTVNGLGRNDRPSFLLPLTPCQWYETGSCDWREMVDLYSRTGDYQTDPTKQRMLAAALAPYAMNLTCSIPTGGFTYGLDRSTTSGCASDDAMPGMGVQVLESGTVDRGANAACGDTEIGPPILWRTRCLHVRQAEKDDDNVNIATPNNPLQGQSLFLSTTDRIAGDVDPLRTRGHSVDFRLVKPVDLRFAAAGADVWATPKFEELGKASPGANNDLPVNFVAEARIQGQDKWQPVPVCETRDGDDCHTGVQQLPSGKVLDLSGFVGQQVEVAFRIQLPHPTLTDFAPDSARESSLAVHGLSVDAGYLRLIDLNLQLRAWTDPSIQGEGWNVRGVELFGLPIKANVGIHTFESKAKVADQLHVHVDDAADRDLFMSAPVNLTVYNQGTRTQTLPLEASLRAQADDRWVYSTSPAWDRQTGEEAIKAEGKCHVQIEPGEVTVKPGHAKRVSARVSFLPEDARERLDPDDPDVDREAKAHCFPGQFDSAPDRDSDDTPERDLEFNLSVNLTDIPEGDYVASDDVFSQELRPNPFLEHEFAGNEEHQPALRIGDFNVTPTRPAPGQPVRVEANVSLVDRSDRGASLSLQFVDPGTGEIVRELEGTDADTPVTTFQPYRRTSMNWTLADVPEGAHLVRLKAEIQRDGEPVVDRAHAWMAKGSVAEHVEHFDWFELSASSGSGPVQTTSEGNETAWTTGEDDDDGGSPFQQVFSGSRSGGNEPPAFAIGPDEWLTLEDSPPPLVGIRARWSFDGQDADRSKDGIQAADGWAVQVCHVSGNPQGGECPTSVSEDGRSSTGDGWAWRTVDIVRAPKDTRGQVAGLSQYRDPGACQQQDGEQGPPCSSARADWSNMRSGESVITRTSPGFARDLDEEGAFSTVIASMTDCRVETDQCPLEWNGSDRRHNLRVRLVVFGTNETERNTLTVSDISLAPVGVKAEPRQSTAGFPIPEEAPKAVPMESESLGAIGTKVDTDVDEPAGWDVELRGLPATNAIEKSTSPRLFVEAPISPSGVSQSATLVPEFEVTADPLRSVGTLVPIGVQAGEHPDLVVEDVKLGGDIKRGDETLVQVQVKNIGFETSERVEVTGVARYDDGQVNLLEPPKDKERVTVPSLPPGVSETVVLKWTPEASGMATVRVAADLTRAEPLSGPVVKSWDGGEQPELKECSDLGCNNVGTERTDVQPPQRADTSIDVQVLADPPLIVGEPVEVRISVHNDGPATVPAYEVRLLAGVVSLLEDDPLRVTEPLEPGETWTKTVQMIPGFGGDLSLVGRVTSDESIVRELRGLKPGGGTYGEDNVENRQIPVIARGLAVDVPRAVHGEPITENGSLEIPVTLTNLGSESLNVSAAANTESGIGTLVGPDDEPIGTVDLEPGQSQNATLRLLYEGLPTAGRQPVTVDAVSQAGVERRTVQVEVPRQTDVNVRPVVQTAHAGKVTLPVTIDSSGNAPVQAQVAIQAPGITQATSRVQLDPGNTSQVLLDTWLGSSTPSPLQGTVTVHAGETTRYAPLRIVQEGDLLPTIENAQAEGGSQPHVWARLANMGTTPGAVDVSLIQGNETLGTETVRLDGRSTQNVTFDVLPDPGPARIHVHAPATGVELNWTLDVANLMPDIRVLHSRLDPVSPNPGETVTVQATIANEGGSAATLRPGLFVDGVLHTVTAEERTVEPGKVINVRFEWTAEEGEHTLAVSADPQDNVQDMRSSDDARARDVTIQSGSSPMGLNEVPLLPAGPLAVLALLAAAAWVRRGRPE